MAPLSPSMPRSLVITALLFISHLAAHINAETFTQTVPDNDLGANCALTIGGYHYDLCPLIETSVIVPVEESDLNDDPEAHFPRPGLRFESRFFLFNLGLGYRQSAPELAPCEENSWVCLSSLVARKLRENPIYDGLTSVTTPIVRKTQTTGVTAALDILEEKGGKTISPLRLLIGDPSVRNGAVQSAKINLYCSKIEKGRYLGETHGQHTFNWGTPHACPITYPRSTASDVSVFEESGDDTEQPPGEDKEQGEDDLMPPQGMSKFRKFMTIALVVLLVPSICAFIFFSSARTRNVTTEKFNTALLPFLSRVALKLRPLGSTINSLTSQSIGRIKAPFRQGEGQLVRWAQEDMTLADSDDFMVNADEDGWNAEGLEEYIPLTMNPQHGRSRRVRSYGSTPDVETFAERQQGLLSGRIGKYFRR